MMRTFRYRLHPSVSQERVLDQWRIQCCTLYNAALEQRITAYRQQGVSVTRYDQIVQLTELRHSDPCWSAAPVLVQRSALCRLDLAYAAFFRRCKNGERPGFPRFRSVRRYDSFSIGCVKVKKGRVLVPKLGHVKLNLYRPIEGTIKNVSVRRDASGKWWVGIHCDLGPAPTKREIQSSVGIDLGLTTLATLSDGREIPNPRFGKQAADLLATRQRKLARKRKGSKNRDKARILVAKTQAHVANQRLDHARKEAKKLFAEFDEVSYEDLSLRGLCRGQFSKSMNDAAWGIFLRCCASKAEEAGKHHTPKDPRQTSQRCSRCGAIAHLSLADRIYRCSSCGLVIGRDHNAAINVRSARPGRSGADMGKAQCAGPVGVEGEASRVFRGEA